MNLFARTALAAFLTPALLVAQAMASGGETDCAGVESHDPIAAVWTADLSKDQVVPTANAKMVLAVRNNLDKPVEVTTVVIVNAAGSTRHVSGPNMLLMDGSVRHVSIQLPPDVDTTAFSAQLEVVLQPTEAGRKLAKATAEPLYFHRSSTGASTYVYDKIGVLTRHQAGDRRGSMLSMVPSQELANLGGLGHGRLLTAKDLSDEQPGSP